MMSVLTKLSAIRAAKNNADALIEYQSRRHPAVYTTDDGRKRRLCACRAFYSLAQIAVERLALGEAHIAFL
jgi:hypothetical protein